MGSPARLPRMTGHTAGQLRRPVAALAAAVTVLLLGAAGEPVAAASPTGTPACERSLQALIDAAPAGSVLTVPPCVYREAVTIDKPLQVQAAGAVIDGARRMGTWLVTRGWWSAASDVTLSGFTMRYADEPAPDGRPPGGPGHEPGHHRATATWASRPGPTCRIRPGRPGHPAGCDVHDAGQLGVHLGGDGEHGHGNQSSATASTATTRPASIRSGRRAA